MPYLKMKAVLETRSVHLMRIPGGYIWCLNETYEKCTIHWENPDQASEINIHV